MINRAVASLGCLFMCSEGLELRPHLTLLTRARRLFRFTAYEEATIEGRSLERHRRVALTVLASAAAKGASLLTTIVSVPLTVRYLGAERYGLWMAIGSIVAMFSFADLGIGNGLINAVSEAHGRNDRDGARRSVSSAFFILAGVAALVAAAFALVYPWVPWHRIFNVKTAIAVQESGPAMAAFVFCFALNMPLGVVQRVQLGYQEGFASSIWQCVGTAISLAALLLVIYLRGGLVWLVLSVSGAPTIALLANHLDMFYRRRPWLRPRLGAVSINAASRICRLGGLFLTLQIAMALAFSSDNLVAAQLLGAESVAQYAVPFKLFAIPTALLAVVLTPLWPAYGEAITRGDTDWVARTLRRSLKFAATGGAAAAAVLIVFGKQILLRWAGPSIHPTFMLLLGLGAWTVLGACGTCLAMFLNGVNVVRFQAVTAAVMAVCNLGLSILLAHRFGVAGIIWGTVIAYTTCTLIPIAIWIPSLLRHVSRASQVPFTAGKGADK